MTSEEMNVYKMRITQAGVGELTVIMLEMEMQWIREALEAYEKGDMDTYISYVEKAQATQVELMNGLNLDNEVSKDVYSVYVFFNKQLINSKIKKAPQDLDRIVDMLAEYHESFKAIANTDDGKPVMDQSEKVYAGLTYGSGGLVENSTGGTEYKA
ncbi:MAG: flagellar protein FliS [Lachnospiraceae bacterium]|nr:flagellar protein FliS [Lachnospiraceae bacterium]